jgi:hypothetical protein
LRLLLLLLLLLALLLLLLLLRSLGLLPAPAPPLPRRGVLPLAWRLAVVPPFDRLLRPIFPTTSPNRSFPDLLFFS